MRALDFVTRILPKTLPNSLHFVASNYGPVGMENVEGNNVLLLWDSATSAEESRVGLRLPTDGELYEVRTIERLATLFGIVEDMGYTHCTVNPPPTPGRPLILFTLSDYFEHARKVAV